MNIYRKEKDVEIFVKTHEAANLSNNQGGTGGSEVRIVSAFSIFLSQALLFSLNSNNYHRLVATSTN